MVALPLMAMLPWKVKKLRNYFPMNDESMWQYNVFSRTDHELTVRDSIFCKGDTLINGKRYVVFADKHSKLSQRGNWYTNFPAGYWRFDKTRLYRYHTNQKHDVLFADFSKRTGEQSEYATDTLLYTVRVLSTDTMYRIPMRIKIHTSDEPFEPEPFLHTYCVEWSEKKSTERVILFFKEGVGLVGLKMASRDELYLHAYAVRSK